MPATATEYFPGVDKIQYEGADSRNPFAFKHYDPDQVIAGKTMREHMRFGVCYWHTMRNGGADPFGGPTRNMPWETDGSNEMEIAENTMRANFEFISKLGVDYWCFHDRDISPEAKTLSQTNKQLDQIVALAKTLQNDTGIKLLWGTACLFINPRFMSGAGTSPFLDAFVHAAAQVKKAMEVTHDL